MGRKARAANARADKAEETAIIAIAGYFQLSHAVAEQHARHECRCEWSFGIEGARHLDLTSDVCHLAGIERSANNPEGSR